MSNSKVNHELAWELRHLIESYILSCGATSKEDVYTIITSLSVKAIELARLSGISLKTYQGAVSDTWTKWDQKGDKNNAN